MRLLLVLFGFVYLLEAAKYKYFAENLGEIPLTEIIWVHHNKDLNIFVAGEAPSKGLQVWLETGDTARFLAELRSKPGVYGADELPQLEATEKETFLIQGSDPVARFSLLARVMIEGEPRFFANQGSRLPADIVTDFSTDFKLWYINAARVEELQDDLSNDYPSGPETIRFTGRRTCPDNDAVVYVEFDAKDLPLSTPLFWTQSGGANAVFWPTEDIYSSLSSLIDDGDVTMLFEETVQNEDVCFSLASPVNIAADGKQIWEVPIAKGHKLFFVTSPFDLPTGATDYFIAPDLNGLTPWNGNVLHRALDVTDSIKVWGVANGKVVILDAVNAGDALSVFLFDHYPRGDEFVEEEQRLVDGYPIGICGSYQLQEDGTYLAKEWQNHPYDCTDQHTGNECMFCKGRGNDMVVSLCLERLGAGCNLAFNSLPTPIFCNLEFECPASTITFSLLLAVLMFVLIFVTY